MPSARRHFLTAGTVLALCLALIAGALTPLGVSAAVSAQPLGQQPAPGFSKIFLPDTIGPGSVSTLRFTINNGNGSSITGLTFTDNLPAGVVVASPGNPATTCSEGVVTAPNGAGTISLSGGKLAAGASCTVSVNVTSSTPGTHTNTSGDLTSSAGNSGTAAADLTVATDRPGFTKSFSPNSIQKGERTRLTFTIDNTANTAFATNFAFVDNLPTGLVVATPPNAVNGCPGGTLSASAGSAAISMSANFVGGSLAAGSSCTIGVDILATGSGEPIGNTSGELTATVGNGFTVRSSGKAGATLTVPFLDMLRLEKGFVDDPIPPGGTGTLRFTIRNYNRGEDVSNLTFSDDLDAVLSGLVALDLPATNICGNGSQISGTGQLSFTGGSLAAEEACTFDVSVQVPAGATPGAYVNSTSLISGDYAGRSEDGEPATDTLFVEPTPLLTKSFIDDPVGGGGTVTLEFSITNTSPDNAAADIAFTDEFPEIIQTAYSVPSAGFCGAGSTATFIPLNASSGTPASLAISGGNLAAGASCTFQVVLDVIDGAPGGVYPNTTSEISAVIDGSTVTGPGASDDLTVAGAPRLTKEFTDDPVLAGTTVTLEFTLSHAATAAGNATNISFSDDLGAVLAGLTSTSGIQNDVCGTNSTLSGTSILSLTGASLAPGESCTFSAILQTPAGAAPGSHPNTTSDVSATVAGVATTGNPASDDLKIAALTLTKSFTDDPVLPGGTVTLNFTINNVSTTDDATNILFQDDLDATLSGLAATGLPLSDPCGSGSSLIGTSGNTFLTFFGGSLAAGASCSFSVTLAVPANATANQYVNRTTGFSATVDGTTIQFENGRDTLVVEKDIIGLAKSFTDDPVLPGGTVTLQFIVTNLSAVNPLSAIAFNDPLDAILSGLAATSPTQNDICGTGSQLSGTTTLNFSGGSLAPGASCTFSVQIQVPNSAVAGATANNTTSVPTGQSGSASVSGNAATDTLRIATPAITADAGGPYSVNEGGQPITITGSSSTIGALEYSWDLDNNGTFETSGQSFVFDPGTADGPTTIPIVLRVRPAGGGQAATSASSIIVNNVAPTIALSGNASVNEGSPYALTLGAVTDPGDDTVTQYVVHWGDGNTDIYAGNGVVNHTYADGVSTPTITVDLVDEDGTHTGAGTLGLTVNNVAPTIALSGDASVDEGSPYALTLGAVTDPGDDTVTQYIVHWGDGNTDIYAGNGVINHTYADGVTTPTITVDLVDEDGTHTDAGTLGLTVNNVAPTIALSGDASVDEGSPYALTLGAVTDPGDDTVTQYIVHWGDGNTESFGSAGVVNHTYADGVTTPTITVDLVDEDGTHTDAGTLGLTVNNVAPTIALSGDASVDEGSPYALTLGAVTDPGDDTVTQYIVHWGDGNTDIYAGNGVVTHVYDDGPSSQTITVDLVDEDGTFTDAGTLSLTVDNVPPSATFNNNGPVNEGALINLSLTGASDPSDADETAGFTYAFDCGDGNGFSSFTSANSATCPTAGNAGTRTVGGIIKDKDDGETPYTATVYVIPSREVKQNLRNALALLLPTFDKNDDKDIEKALESIDDSLDDKYWETDSRLTKKGNKVFDEEKKAVKDLQKVDTVNVSAYILGLVEVDRVLAVVQIADAVDANGDPKYLDKAYERMADAQAEIDEGDFDKAIDDYKKAWEYARKAAGKPVEAASIDMSEEVEANFRLFLPMSAKQ